jgi:hypothetical protein
MGFGTLLSLASMPSKADNKNIANINIMATADIIRLFLKT